MLENRSFDHMLGQSGIPSIEVPNKSDTNLDPRTNQYIAAGPFPIAPVYQLDNSYRDPSHEFINTLEQLTRLTKFPPNTPYPANKIDNSGFVIDYHDNAKSQKEDNVMYGFTEDQLPVINDLARKFAVCDCWFSSLPGHRPALCLSYKTVSHRCIKLNSSIIERENPNKSILSDKLFIYCEYNFPGH